MLIPGVMHLAQCPAHRHRSTRVCRIHHYFPFSLLVQFTMLGYLSYHL